MRRETEGGYNPDERPGEFEQTPEELRRGVDKLINWLCNDFEVEGEENLDRAREEEPESKFIIASSHISNLDAPSAIKALGDKFNVQITAESVLFGLTPQEMLFRLGGKGNVSSLEYRKTKGGKQGVFNPDDFTELESQMKDGKTPWIAIHPFTTTEKMQKPRIGAVYLST